VTPCARTLRARRPRTLWTEWGRSVRRLEGEAGGVCAAKSADTWAGLQLRAARHAWQGSPAPALKFAIDPPPRRVSPGGTNSSAATRTRPGGRPPGRQAFARMRSGVRSQGPGRRLPRPRGNGARSSARAPFSPGPPPRPPHQRRFAANFAVRNRARFSLPPRFRPCAR
jgi:hypothetical protein